MKKDYFFLALGNLKHRGLRSWLTILGIFIGIAAVVALISLGQGLEKGIERQFEVLGKDKIMVEPKGMGPPGSTTVGSLILTSKDLEIIENIGGVEWAMGYLMRVGQMKFKGESQIGYMVGVDPDDFEESLKLQGVGFLEGKIPKDSKTKVAVGYNLAVDDKVWKRGVKIGDKIEIEGQEFKVEGILEKIGDSKDNMIIFDKETLKNLLNVEDEESEIIVKVENVEEVEDIAEEIKTKLRKFRKEKEGQETFIVSTLEQLIDSFKEILGIVQAVLVGIAVISLFVGGIGIMNTMYTSVLERTKEIGVMKAIGAKNSDVLSIFLIESGFLGLVGGIIGAIFGVGIAKTVEYISEGALGARVLQAEISLSLIVGALLFSFLVGTLSGILPAMRAAKLKPVDALRQE